MTTAQRNVSIGIVVTYGAKDEASAVQQRVTQRADQADKSFKRNTQSLQQLSAGLAVVGGGMLALSSVLRRQQSEFAQTSAKVLETTGLFLTGAAGALQFAAAIGKVVVALKAMRNAQLASAAAGALSGGGLGGGITGKGLGGIGRSGLATAGLGLGSKAGLPGLLIAGFLAATLGAGYLARKGGPLDFATPLGFANGGRVPGPIGVAQAAIVHGGEMITPAGRGVGGGGNVTLNIGTLMGSESDARRLAQLVNRYAREEARRGAGGQRNR